MGFIEICNKLEEFIADLYGTQDFDNIKRQMEIRNIPVRGGETKEVLMLKKSGSAYQANSAYFKIKADIGVDADGNIYIPFPGKTDGEKRYLYVRKIENPHITKMIREIMSKVDRHNEKTEAALEYDRHHKAVRL